MNRHTCQLLLVAAVALMLAACKSDTPQGESMISGIVSDALSGAPLSGVTIQAQSVVVGNQTTVTNAAGTYTFNFTLDDSATVTLFVTKFGYRDTTVVVQIRSGVSVPLNLQLSPKSPIVGGGGSGVAQTIAFLGADPQEVSVYGVGGQETAVLGWEVRDSLGLPIDANNAVNLTFTVNGGLNGGEYVSPPVVRTSASGRAYHTFNSGTSSGVVQILAMTTVGARTITSAPVRVVIHAGFPDKGHFSIGVARLNFPTLGVINNRDRVSVLVGDIYANPVALNTAVYFTTRAGVIQASGFTDASGQASVDLISGVPFPIFSNALTPLGNGYHYLLASTLGQGGIVVRDSGLVLWTGASRIDSITPGSFNILNGGAQSVSFKVSDQFGNTLSSPSTISVSARGAQAEVAFGFNGSFTIDKDIILPRGALTWFTLTVLDSRPDTSYLSSASVTISVTSAGNGNATAGIGGTIR